MYAGTDGCPTHAGAPHMLCMCGFVLCHCPTGGFIAPKGQQKIAGGNAPGKGK